MSPSSLKLKAFWGGMLLLRSPVWDDDDDDSDDGDGDGVGSSTYNVSSLT